MQSVDNIIPKYCKGSKQKRSFAILQNLIIMNCLSSNLNKILAAATVLSLLSLSVIIYNVDRILSSDNVERSTDKLTEDKTITDGIAVDSETNENIYMINAVTIFVASLTFFINLLLCQGALDLASLELYFWPDPEIIKIWWIVVYIPLLFVYIYGMLICFYLAISEIQEGTMFVNEDDNHIKWGFIYLFGDIIMALSIYFVPQWYSKL